MDSPIAWVLLFLLGTLTGLVAGILGIGGGLLMVPALTLAGVPLVRATATSLVSVFLSSVSGSIRNWRAGELNVRASLGLAIAGIPTAQLGAWLGHRTPDTWLSLSFAALQLLAIYLMDLRKKLDALDDVQTPKFALLPLVGIGLLAGVLAGLFGVGGGVVMVPLQMLFLGEPIKSAVRTSLGAIVLIGASGLAQHAWNNNVLWIPGLCLGLGGILGAQFGTRLLPRLREKTVNLLFRLLLFALSLYMVWRGLQAYNF